MSRALPTALLALAASLLGGSCGGIHAQDRPSIVATYPAGGAVVPGWLGYVRVVYDEPIRVLNETAARLTIPDVDTQAGETDVRIFADPQDDHAILIKPYHGGHFFPGVVNRIEVREGAVVNHDDHYLLTEYDFEFTLGGPPSLFLASSDGNVYEVSGITGAFVSVTAPPAGYRARDPLGSISRVFVWLDPVAPGSTLLGTFRPGDASMTVVPLAGESGARLGTGLTLSIDARTLFATAEDAGSNRLVVHRVDTVAATEVPSALVLSTPLAGSGTTFRPAVDTDRNVLAVAASDGAGAGFMSFVDLATFTEKDMAPDPGVNPLALADGAGDLAYEPDREYLYMLLHNLTTAGFVVLEAANDYKQYPAVETADAGRPNAMYPTPDSNWFIQGLDGYPGTAGLVRSEGSEINNGFSLPVVDDVGGLLQNCHRVDALIGYPASTRMYAFLDNGVSSVLCAFAVFDQTPEQVDLDPFADGLQGLDLSIAVPGIVTGATTLVGWVGP